MDWIAYLIAAPFVAIGLYAAWRFIDPLRRDDIPQWPRPDLLDKLYEPCRRWKRCKDTRYEAADEIMKLRAQLPDGMRDCTIKFIACDKGHGRLTATNWIDRGCPWCMLDALGAFECKWCGRRLSSGTECAKCAYDQSLTV